MWWMTYAYIDLRMMSLIMDVTASGESSLAWLKDTMVTMTVTWKQCMNF